MPMRWVRPEIFVFGTDDNPAVYRCYKSCGSVTMEYWYQIEDETSSTGWTMFDIRSLESELGLSWKRAHRTIIHIAEFAMGLRKWIQSGRVEIAEGNG